ncbi:AAA family ATPase [Arcobacter sp. s6]|uniref:AAA family ATPase n=1 Tax=Arcobacter sp. s6 TaxID=3230363 RepID=UPI0034A02784
MKLKILYMKVIHDIDKFLDDENDYYILTPDAWDDYSYQTTFSVKIIKNKQEFEEFEIKLLFRGQNIEKSSFEIIDELLGDSDIIDIQSISDKFEFISLGNHYEELKEIFDDEELDYLLKRLNDISYLELIHSRQDLWDITKEDGFETSLLRDQYSKRVYYEGIDKVLNSIKIAPEECFFSFSFNLGTRTYNYSFNFFDEILPSRINVLIGKNGVGKTKTLENLVDYLINPRNSSSKAVPHPNFLTNLCVFSYNPHDNFYIYKKHDNISIEYKYLGFNRYKTLRDGIDIFDFKNDEINFDILKTLHNDHQDKIFWLNSEDKTKRQGHIEDLITEINKNFKIDRQIIQNAINLNLKIINEKISDSKNFDLISFNSFIELCEEDEKKSKYVKIFHPLSEAYENIISDYIPKIYYIGLKKLNGDIEFFDNFKDFLNINKSDFFQELFYFDENEKEVNLSSGQKMYSNLLLNLYSMIKENSLIIIDEPENTLHPNFEIGFIKILNAILEKFNSYAIIATHSSIIAREIPTKFINMIVLDEDKDIVEIQKPVMKSFGASITDITNYIFDDVFYENKPYSKWLEKQVSEYKKQLKDFEEFKKDYQEILSYELLLEANDIFRKNTHV